MTQPTSAASNATLLIEASDRLLAFPLAGETMIGRHRRNAIVVDHPTVSRQHARLYRDTTGWHYEDLGSQNGSKLGAARTEGASVLAEGAELRIGRVRAWFFSGPVPAEWNPPDSPRLAGKLIRCVCGHIGWAPVKSGDGHLRCNACGRDIMRRDPSKPTPMNQFRPATPIAATSSDCAACHTAISRGEPMHTCSDCHATMHADCWNENRGCATYGCPQVGVLDRADEVATTEAVTASSSSTTHETPEHAGSESDSASEAFKQSLMATAVFALAGLPLFGVPPIGYAAYRMVAADTSHEGARRFAWAAISAVAGVAGFGCSAMWWLGARA